MLSCWGAGSEAGGKRGSHLFSVFFLKCRVASGTCHTSLVHFLGYPEARPREIASSVWDMGGAVCSVRKKWHWESEAVGEGNPEKTHDKIWLQNHRWCPVDFPWGDGTVHLFTSDRAPPANWRHSSTYIRVGEIVGCFGYNFFYRDEDNLQTVIPPNKSSHASRSC